jgi:hypothetical protein
MQYSDYYHEKLCFLNVRKGGTRKPFTWKKMAMARSLILVPNLFDDLHA